MGSSEISIKYSDLNSLGEAIYANGNSLGWLMGAWQMDNESNIPANAAAHNAIEVEAKHKGILETMSAQEKTNLANIGNQLYTMEESLISFYSSTLSKEG
jgi:hypothetical protein